MADEWEDYLEKCDEILEGNSPNDFGHDFIESVKEWIEENKHVTDKQMAGIDKIYDIYEDKEWL